MTRDPYYAPKDEDAVVMIISFFSREHVLFQHTGDNILKTFKQQQLARVKLCWEGSRNRYT